MLQELTNKIKDIIPEIEEEMEEQEQITEQAGDFIRQSQRPSGKTNVYERDITLEDVLRCLKSDYYINEDGYLYSIMSENEDGGIYLEMVSPGIHWKLGKPLHEQSKETIKELNKLI